MRTLDFKQAFINTIINSIILLDLHLKSEGRLGVLSIFLAGMSMLVFINLIKAQEKMLELFYILGQSLMQLLGRIALIQVLSSFGSVFLFALLFFKKYGIDLGILSTSLLINTVLIVLKLLYLLALKRRLR